MAGQGWAEIIMLIIQMGKYKVLRENVPSDTLPNDD